MGSRPLFIDMIPLKLSKVSSLSGGSTFSKFRSFLNSDDAMRKFQISLIGRRSHDTGSNIRMHEGGATANIFNGMGFKDIPTENGPVMRFRDDGILDRIPFAPVSSRRQIIMEWIKSASTGSEGLSTLCQIYNARYLRSLNGGFKSYGELRAVNGLVEPEAEIGSLLNAIRKPLSEAIINTLQKDLNVLNLQFDQILAYLYGASGDRTQLISLNDSLNGIFQSLNVFGLTATDITSDMIGSDANNSIVRALNIKKLPGLRSEGIVYIKLGAERSTTKGMLKGLLGLGGSSGLSMNGDGILASPRDVPGHVYTDLSLIFDMDTARSKLYPPNVGFAAAQAPSILSPNMFHELGHAMQFLTWNDAQWNVHQALAELRALDVAETPAIFFELLTLIPTSCSILKQSNNSVSPDDKIRRAQRILIMLRFLISAELDFKFNHIWKQNMGSRELMHMTAETLKECLPGVSGIPQYFSPLYLPWAHGAGTPYAGSMQAYLLALTRAAPHLLAVSCADSESERRMAGQTALSELFCLNPFGSKTSGRDVKKEGESNFAVPLAHSLLAGGGLRTEQKKDIHQKHTQNTNNIGKLENKKQNGMRVIKRPDASQSQNIVTGLKKGPKQSEITALDALVKIVEM